jgi:hypothetical protein
LKNTIKIHSRAWCPGDLVKIKSSLWNGRDHESVGIVLKCAIESEKQIKIFSEVPVFDMKLGDIRNYYGYDIELISSST